MNPRYAEESGPDEDFHTVKKSKPSKVLETESPAKFTWPSGVFETERKSPEITHFLKSVPILLRQGETYGLIWDKSLQPADHKYEMGEHYLSTREMGKESVHGKVSFYRDGATGVKFAIKTLQSVYFRPEEVMISLNNQHPNICAVYGIILRDGCVHILLEHAGSPLNEERAWIAESQACMLSLARQCFQALEIVHGCGYVHCDIKPDNIMIRKDANGTEFTVKLIDFGSCQQAGTILSEKSYTTLLYWSPEIWQAVHNKEKITCRPEMDVYALALTFYFVQTSHHLVQIINNQDKKDLMTKNPNDLLVIALPDTIPSQLRIIMKQCLDGKPENRLNAEQGVKQLSEDTRKQQMLTTVSGENYKDSLTRIISLQGIAKEVEDFNVGFQLSSPSFMLPQNPQESMSSVQYFVGSSKGIEKREFKTGSKGRKNICFTSNKFSKPSSRGRKSTKLSGKTSSSQAPLESSKISINNQNSIVETDDNSYACSNLLKHIALKAQPSQYNVELSSQLASRSCIQINPEVSNALTQSDAALNLNHVVNLQSKSHELPNDVSIMAPKQRRSHSYQLNINERESDAQVKYKFKGNNEKNDVGKTGENKTLTLFEATDIASVESNSVPTPLSSFAEGKSVKDSETSGDDMDFVYSAFDNIVGSDMEIIDNWCRILDEEEHISKRLKVISNQDTEHCTHKSQAEPMDTGHDKSCNPSNRIAENVSTHPASISVRGSRKRIAEPTLNHSGIPGKSVFPLSHSSLHEQQLPCFDQILPEKV